MRNKFVYSFSIKIPALGFDELLETFSASCWLWKCFPCRCCGDAWRSGSWLARSQVNVAGGANLCGPVRSTFGVLVVRCAVTRCRGEELGPSCWPLLGARCCRCQCISSICWACFSDIMVSPGFRIQKAAVDQTSSRLPVTMTFFWCKFGFGKCFGASSQSSHWAGHCWLLYAVHFSSQVTIPIEKWFVAVA